MTDHRQPGSGQPPDLPPPPGGHPDPDGHLPASPGHSPPTGPATPDDPGAPAGSATAPAAPIDPSERNVTLDILRGFAMLGILLVNMQLFRGALWPAMLGEAPWTGLSDRIIDIATVWFAQTKFITSFAFMLGLGTAVQMMRSTARGDSPVGKLPRRFGVLFAIGLLHGLLIWTGDILMLYAICGFALLMFARMRVRGLLWWAGGTTTVLALIGLAFAGLLYWMSTAFGDVEGMDADAGMAFLEPIVDRAMEVYTAGSYLDQVAFRLLELPFTQMGSLFYAPLLFVLMLLGMAAAKSGMVTETERFTGLLKRARLWGLGLGIPLNGIMALGQEAGGGQYAMMGPGGGTEEMSALVVASLPLIFIAPPILAMGYLATLTLACRSQTVRARLSPLAAVGRMAISAYLFQSIVGTAFFLVTGLYGSASPTVGLAVILAIWAVLLVVCPLWLRRFRMGPVEWLWRSLTYGHRPPLRARA